jgi:ABC-type Mn2+/Zn2+ transport system permease subunit
LFTLIFVGWLVVASRRGSSLFEAKIGAVYVLSLGISILLLAKCPTAERGWLNLMKGEVVAVTLKDLLMTSGIFGAATAVLMIFRREFLLVSYDPEMAITLKKNVLFWQSLFFLLLGINVSVAVLVVGPLITFGFLLLPAMIAHGLASNMRQFFLLASAVGGFGGLFGFACASKWDLPVGPAAVSLLGAVYAIGVVIRKVRQAM